MAFISVLFVVAAILVAAVLLRAREKLALVLALCVAGTSLGQAPKKKGVPLNHAGSVRIDVHLYFHLVPSSGRACEASKEPELQIGESPGCLCVPWCMCPLGKCVCNLCPCRAPCSCADWSVECKCAEMGGSGAKCQKETPDGPGGRLKDLPGYCPCEKAGGCCCDPCGCGKIRKQRSNSHGR